MWTDIFTSNNLLHLFVYDKLYCFLLLVFGSIWDNLDDWKKPKNLDSPDSGVAILFDKVCNWEVKFYYLVLLFLPNFPNCLFCSLTLFLFKFAFNLPKASCEIACSTILFWHFLISLRFWKTFGKWSSESIWWRRLVRNRLIY